MIIQETHFFHPCKGTRFLWCSRVQTCGGRCVCLVAVILVQLCRLVTQSGHRKGSFTVCANGRTAGRPVKVTIMVWNIQLCLRRTCHYLRIPECPVQLYNCLFDFIHRVYYWMNEPPPPSFSSQKCSSLLT
jgi:hypothetical protein